MATENSALRAQPRLVVAGERVVQPGPVRPIKAVEQPVQLHSAAAGNALPAPPIGPIASHLLKADDAPNCVQALELISCAAQTMTSMEHQSKRIQATALALTRHTRSERVEFSQQIAALQEQVMDLQEQLEDSEARADSLERQLADAEQRADTAEEWLRRLQEAIISAFSDRRLDNCLDDVASVLGAHA